MHDLLPMLRTRLGVIAVVVPGLTLLLAFLIYFDVIPALRGDYGWRWPYGPVDTLPALVIVVVMAAYVGGVALLRTRRTALLLVWAVLGTVALSLAVADAREGDAGYGLFIRIASGGTTGPHMAASLQIDWQSDDWRNWPETMRRIGGHVGTSPPGLPMLYGLVTAAMDAVPGITDALHRHYLNYQCHNYLLLDYTPSEWASAWVGVLMPLWAGLAVFPLYGAARCLLHDETLARWVVILWPLVPAVIAFAASWSTVYPLLSAGAFYLFLRGVDAPGRGQWLWFFGAALVLGIALFAHFVFLPMLGLLGFYTLGVWWLGRDADGARRPFSWAVLVGAVTGAGVLLPWLLYWLAGGATLFAVLEAGFDYHLALDRPVWFWRYWNVVDWLLWTGMAACVLWIAGTLRGLQRDGSTNPPLLGISLLLTVLVMAISGTTLGESGRIWLFMSPFLLLAALDGVQRLVAAPVRGRVMWLWTGTQAVFAVVMVVSIWVFGDDFTVPPHPPQVTVTRPVDVTFDPTQAGAFRLTGWDAGVEDGAVQLSLTWQSVEQPLVPYWFGATPVGPDGQVGDLVLWQPNESAGRAARYPTTCWTPGVTVGDTITVPLPEGAEPGEWWVSLAAFGDATGLEGRVPVLLPDGTQDVQVGLGPVTVGE